MRGMQWVPLTRPALTRGPPCRGRDNDLVKRETAVNAAWIKAAGIKP